MKEHFVGAKLGNFSGKSRKANKKGHPTKDVLFLLKTSTNKSILPQALLEIEHFILDAL